MKVLVVGATGVVGRPLLARLAEAGHEVVATARHVPRAVPEGVQAPAAGPARRRRHGRARRGPPAGRHHPPGDGPVRARQQRAPLRPGVRGHQPVAHRRHPHPDHRRARAPRPPQAVAQSCGWPWAPEGGSVKTEQDRLDPDPAPAFRRTFAAIVELERLVTSYPNGVVLRYGALYGPGTSLGARGAQVEAIRRRRFPLVGDAGAVWSFLHVEDAADAAVAALARGHGVYNVVDDDPVRVGNGCRRWRACWVRRNRDVCRCGWPERSAARGWCT